MRDTIIRKGPEIRRRVLMGVIFVGPLLFMRNLHDVINLPKLWLVAVAVAVVGGIRAVELLQGSDRSLLRLLFIPAGALLVPLTIGWAFSPLRMWALLGDTARYTGLVPYILVIAFGILVADAFVGYLVPLAWALVGSGAIAGAYAVVQFVGLDPFEWTYKGGASELITSTLGNPNFAGGFFCTVLPVSVGLLVKDEGRRVMAGTCAAFIAVGWVLTRSETAWGAGVAALAVLAGGLLVGRLKWSRLAGFIVAGAVLAGGLTLVGLSMLPTDPGVTPRNLERRGEWWEASLKMVADTPVVGRGPNAFAVDHTRYRTLSDVDQAGFDVTDDPHSVFLSFATAAGIFGAAGFLVFGGWILSKTWRTPADRGLTLFFGAAGCAYLVQSFFSVDTVALRLVAWTVIAGLAAGTAQARLVAPNRKRSTKRKPATRAEPLKALPGVALALVLALGLVWWATGLITADAAFARAQRSLSEGEGEASLSAFEDALGFRNNDSYARTYASLLTPVAVGLAESGAEEHARGLFGEVTRILDVANEIPIASSRLTLARAFRDWAEVDQSVEMRSLQEYERAFELDPRNYLLLEEAADVAEEFGEPALADELVRRAETIKEADR